MDSRPFADTSLAEPAAEPNVSAPEKSQPTASSRFNHPASWLAGMALLSLAASYFPARSYSSILLSVIFSTVLYVVLVVGLASSAGRIFNVPRQRPLWQVLAWTGVAIGLWALSEFVITPPIRQAVTPLMRQNLPLPAGLDALRLINLTLRPLFLVAGATFGGVALGRLVKYPNMLGPLAGVAALIDIWGVLFGGIVSKLMTSPTSAPVAQKMMAPLPTVGAAHGAGGGTGIQLASVGTGDFLFLGLFFGVLWAHGMNARGAQKWITPLVSLALAAIVIGWIGFLPGLLFIGLGAMIPNLKYLRYTREERFALLYAAGFVALLTAGLYFSITSRLK